MSSLKQVSSGPVRHLLGNRCNSRPILAIGTSKAAINTTAAAEFVIDGIETTIPLFQDLINQPDIQNGDYGSANSNMSGSKSFNAALAKVLGGAAAGAQTLLDGSADKASAIGPYLMAIIGARQSNGDMVRNHLGMSVQKDASLREKAMKDLEFRNVKGQLGL